MWPIILESADTLLQEDAGYIYDESDASDEVGWLRDEYYAEPTPTLQDTPPTAPPAKLPLPVKPQVLAVTGHSLPRACGGASWPGADVQQP